MSRIKKLTVLFILEWNLYHFHYQEVNNFRPNYNAHNKIIINLISYSM